MAYDTNGLVTVEAVPGTAGGRAAASAFLTPTPTEWGISSLIEGILGQLEAAAVIAIDLKTRKIYFTDDATKGAALRAAGVNADEANTMLYNPTTGQTGKTLVWEGTATGDIAAMDVGDVMSDLYTPQPPRRSVASMVSAIISATGSQVGGQVPDVIVIDQINKHVVCNLGDKSAALAALSLNAGNSGVLTLSEPADGGAAAPLPFEGGAV